MPSPSNEKMVAPSSGSISLQIQPVNMRLIDEGAQLYADALTRTRHRIRPYRPSSTAWMKLFIDYAYQNRATAALHLDQVRHWATAAEKPRRLGLTSFPDEQKIQIRRFAWELQQHDWSVDFDRVAAVNFMLAVYGEAFNESLKRL